MQLFLCSNHVNHSSDFWGNVIPIQETHQLRSVKKESARDIMSSGMVVMRCPHCNSPFGVARFDSARGTVLYSFLDSIRN